MAKNNEFNIQLAFAHWLKVQLPDVIFRSDLGGIYIPNRRKAGELASAQCSRGYPDVFIAQPSGGFFGLFIEVKTKEGMYNKNGSFKRTEHMFEQAKMLEQLHKLGYYADFGIGFDACCNLTIAYISNLLKPRPTHPPLYKMYIDYTEDWYYGRLPELRLSV